MSFITLDFETSYRSRANRGTTGPRYSLKSLTYEEYLGNSEFAVHGVAVKVDMEPTIWVSGADVEPYLQDLFTPGNDHTILAHNAAFDLAILSWHYGLSAQTYYCTQAMSRALWQTERHSLDRLARRCFPDDPTKRKGNELEEVDGIMAPTPKQLEVLGGYAINDVELTFECFRYMWPFFPDKELELIDLTLEMIAHPLLHLDIERVEAFLATTIAEKERLIEQSGVPRTTLSSNPRFARWLKDRHGIDVPLKHSPTPKNPDNHTWALARDDLEFMQIRQDNPQLAHVFAARIAIKSTTDESRSRRLLQAAQSLRHKPAPVIAMPLNYAAAHTLRWGGTNKANPQNLRRGGELRKSLAAPPEHQLVIVDLSNIESRVVAWLAQCHDLLRAYAEGRDVYNDFGAEIYHRRIDRNNGDDLEGHVAKVAVLGLSYGMGAPKFQNTLAQGALGGPPVHFDLEECYRIVNQTYRRRYAEIPALWREFDNVIIPSMANPDLEPFKWKEIFQVEYQRLQLPNGLYLNYPHLRPIEHPDGGYHYWEGSYDKSLYGGLATENVTQAVARIILAEQMLHIREQIQQYSARIILTVHDELIAVAPTAHASTVLETMLTAMRTSPSWAAHIPGLVLDAKGDISPHYL